jgi:ATP/maltotriose-dependent transcriptional regulator MalT
MGLEDYTAYQQKIIKRYYSQQDTIQLQRLGELVTELYLAEGKKRDKLWTSAASAMQKLGIPQSRIDHLLSVKDPTLIAKVVKDLQAGKG